MSVSDLEIDIDCALSNIYEKSASAPSSPNERSSVLRDIGNVGGHAKARRVTFPDDETIVTGYFEAPDPWGEDCPVSTDNIVAAYRAACWKQGVKPLQKVLQQLQNVQMTADLEFELNLKGENLDAHHCEALEEIFKRLQFRSLLLENSNLDDEGAAAIFDMIEYYDTTSHLNISGNKNIGNQGWQACSKMLKRTPCLQYLDASKTSQNEQSLLILGRAFRTGSYLVTLHLENSGIFGRPLVILVAALKLNSTLLELYLGENKICSADGLQLGNLLRSNSTLELLDLRTNNLQDLGICHLIDGLCQQAANCGECLKTLNLSNNGLTRNGMAHVNRALLVSESLTNLDLSNNSICDEGIQQMKQGLLTNQSLQQLNLMNAKITCEGSVALAEFIADNQHIAQIDLRGNDIKLAGLMALSLSLKHNQSMICLNVDQTIKTNVGEDGMNNEMKLIEEIAEYCKRNENRINSEILQDKNINFVVQNSNIPVVTNETELTALLQEHEDSSGSGSTIDTSPKSHPSPNRMSSSQTFPGDPVRFPDWSPKNRFQVCRVILDAEMNSQDKSSSSASSTKGESTNQSEESVFFPASPIESGYDSNSSSPFTSKEDANEAEVKKAYIRHQDSIAILKQHGRISSNPAVDVEDQQIHEDDETNDSEEEAGDVGISGEGKSSQSENPQSALMARRASGGKVVKKLTFQLPDDYTEHMNGMKTNRRMSTPAVATQKLVQQKHTAMNLKLGRQLEGLDLKSSVPLSPTRLREGLIFPEPFETKIAIGEGS
ncbi:protein phosphatase 1 regulatory subunit 37 [Trichonephila inaurata madagascariensis]|uniref:Protein phosphatase 1 regulatory subunit 37 n=1 Tax=Trichonephila inaurata madagascariensis TaxID=2747483 RepID=A0A8X6YE12_9ARAC|nr:protein phosphatase 1 regulatory subunit 37 [Trichonephila inaurata madagascariensis]